MSPEFAINLIVQRSTFGHRRFYRWSEKSTVANGDEIGVGDITNWISKWIFINIPFCAIELFLIKTCINLRTNHQFVALNLFPHLKHAYQSVECIQCVGCAHMVSLSVTLMIRKILKLPFQPLCKMLLILYGSSVHTLKVINANHRIVLLTLRLKVWANLLHKWNVKILAIMS